MSTKGCLMRKSSKKLLATDNQEEKKVKKLIEDMINYYKEINKKNIENERNNKKYENIVKKDLVVNMNENTESMIKSYGPELYVTIVEMDSLPKDSTYLKKHEINSVSRTKMVSWMMEIFASYPSEPLSFFLSVNIMDMYLEKTTRKFKDSDIHLIGLVSVYMASKMEDIIPLHMVHIKSKLGNDKYKKEEIVNLERDILKVLSWDVIMITTYDVVKTFLSDFFVNNREMIESLKIENLCFDLEIISIFLSKLICLHEAFYKYNHCIKAIAIIIASFDILRSNFVITKTIEDFIRQWILFLINESKYSIELITKVYNKICKFYEDLKNVNNVAPALCKLHSLKGMMKEI